MIELEIFLMISEEYLPTNDNASLTLLNYLSLVFVALFSTDVV